MSTPATDLSALKQRMKATWVAGDFGKIAEYTAAEAANFIARLNIKPGTRVLDVACGTGNLAVPAAKAGAVVTGIDIAPNLIEQAKARAAREGLKIDFQEGDAEQLAFPDNSFDMVVTMYGAMFAPRPELVADELLRVCKPGGLIAMANWTPEGFTGKMFAVNAKHVPPPEGIPSPVLWGKEDVVKQRFGDRVSKLEVTRQHLLFDYPGFTPADVVEYFKTWFGPTQMAMGKLDDAGKAALTADTVKLWTEHNEGTPTHAKARGEYLQVWATKK